MARQTIQDAIEPFSVFSRSAEAGMAFARAWRSRARNEAEVVARIRKLLIRLHDGQFSDAAADSRRVVDATSAVAMDIDLLAKIDVTSKSMSSGENAARLAFGSARDLALTLGNSKLTGLADVSRFANLSDAQIDGIVASMMKLGSTDQVEVERSLRTQVEARVRGYHGHVVLSAARRRGSAFPAVTASEVALRGRADDLRDGIRIAARGALNADVAWFIQFADSLARYEKNWVLEVGDPAVALLVSGSSAGATVAARRSAALAYDAVRLGLVWLAGGYELLLGWALDDRAALREWTLRSQLPLDSGMLDLPRADVLAVANGAVVAGTDVEVSGVITAAHSEHQAGRVRTVLRLDDRLTVYFPFSAVDGFGVVPGVWCQVRGDVLDESKGGFPPPTVRVRRRKLGDAARAGFNEYLEFMGRDSFSRMRAGDDVIAGRGAHDPRTGNEAADWNQGAR